MRRWQLLSPKQLLPILLGGVAGLLVLADFLAPQNLVFSGQLRSLAGEMVRWTIVLTAFALLAGIANVVLQHVRRLLRRDRESLYSLALLLGLLLVIVSAAVGQIATPGMDPLEDPLVQSLFEYVYTPLSTSIIALLAFFGLSAALRALGSGRREAVVLVLIAIPLLVIQLPLIAQQPVVGSTAAWIENYLLLAGARALILGGAIGALIASVRILMGVDRPYLDR